jgi:choline monooxygenase
VPIDPDIRRAFTLPGEVYHREEYFRRFVERVLPRAWHYVAPREELREPKRAVPVTLCPGALDEPLILVRQDSGELRAMSNVCTHRGNLLIDAPCTPSAIRCRYHGRRFDLDGRFLSMPEFEGAEGFPSARDDLSRVSVAEWGPFIFASLDPALPFAELIAPVEERLRFFGADRLALDPKSVRTYSVAANWALYLDNYLEGFHIPFVHPELSKRLEWAEYRTELFLQSNLQIGIAAEGDEAFALPDGHRDLGQKVAGWYFWLFPTTMINVYPWGISLNVVDPQDATHTRVRFASFARDLGAPREGAGGELDLVERQDEEVVESVQRGVRSRLYSRGRYSPTREACVHHFHRLLSEALEI